MGKKKKKKWGSRRHHNGHTREQAHLEYYRDDLTQRPAAWMVLSLSWMSQQITFFLCLFLCCTHWLKKHKNGTAWNLRKIFRVLKYAGRTHKFQINAEQKQNILFHGQLRVYLNLIWSAWWSVEFFHDSSLIFPFSFLENIKIQQISMFNHNTWKITLITFHIKLRKEPTKDILIFPFVFHYLNLF